MQEAPADLRDDAAREGRTRWRSLVPAFAVSLLMHVLALALLLPSMQRQAARPEPVVSLTAVIVAPKPAPPAAVPEPRPEPASAQARTPVAPVTPAVPPSAAPAAPAPAAPPASAVARAAPPEESRPPVPQDDPFAGQVHPQLVGRRLAARVWLREDGGVDQAQVRPNEVPPDVVTRLEEALARVRFAAGTGEPSGPRRVMDVLLCFDQAGALDTGSPECWSPGSTAPR